MMEERSLSYMNAKQLGDLIEDDYDTNASFESDQDGLRNEVGNETEPQEASDHEHRSNQHRQGGCGS
jgi:hypothetical protein